MVDNDNPLVERIAAPTSDSPSSEINKDSLAEDGKPAIEWIVGSADTALRLYWIDDLAFPAASYTGRRNSPPMSREWMRKYAEVGRVAQLSAEAPLHAKRMLQIKEVCQAREPENAKVAFALTNFEYVHANINEFLADGALLLADVGNEFFTDQLHLVKDPTEFDNFQEEDGRDEDRRHLFFGYVFVKQWLNGPLAKKRLKFFTRGLGDTKDEANDKLGLTFDEDDCIPTSLNELKKKLEQWIDSFLEPVIPPPPSIHPDPFITEAVRFYGMVFSETERGEQKVWTGHWDHEWLMVQSDPVTKQPLPKHPQRIGLEEWLPNVQMDDDSAKALLAQHKNASSHRPILWQEGDFRKEFRKTREVSGRVLKALWRKLDIPVSNEEQINDAEMFKMPCDPCLPFWVSVRCILWCLQKDEVERDNEERVKKYRPLKDITFRKIPKQREDLNVYLLSIQMDKFLNVNDANGKNAIPPFALANSYWSGDWKVGGGGFSTGAGALGNMQRAITIGFTRDASQMPPWTETFTEGAIILGGEAWSEHCKDLEPPIVAIEFTPWRIQISWSAKAA